MKLHPRTRHTSTTATVREVIKPDRIVLALGDAPQRTLIENTIQSQGHSVLCVSSPLEARRFARKKRTAATFLADEFSQHESGWLTCRKLLFENPQHRVVIVGTKQGSQGERMAKFVGALAYLPIGASEAIIEKTVSAIHLLTAN